VTFIITVTNGGNALASNVIVTDVLESFLDPVSVATTKGTATTTGRTLVINIGTVAPNNSETVVITIITRVNDTAVPPTEIHNVADLTYDGGRRTSEVVVITVPGPTPTPTPGVCPPPPAFFWKAGLWRDYAPSGIPDFDQRQNNWRNPVSGQWSFDGPAAAANSLWWFDSKYEANQYGPPAITDTFPLVQAYGNWDDHDPRNVPPFVEDLARYFDTDGRTSSIAHAGSTISATVSGLERYIAAHGLSPSFTVTATQAPPFLLVANEVTRSHDVILLLGYWENQNGRWTRIGGHYVTAVGVETQYDLIAIADPYRDNVEQGGYGRLIPYSHTHTSPVTFTLHNDAAFVAQDIYTATSTTIPFSPWALQGYTPTLTETLNFAGLNVPAELQPYQGSYQGGPLIAAVDYAVRVIPHPEDVITPTPTPATYLCDTFFWKADWWLDYAPSGMPDFDQRQFVSEQVFAFSDLYRDGKIRVDSRPFADKDAVPPADPPTTVLRYDAPAAAGNSLWWFDSKFESGHALPPTIADTYPLVTSYFTTGQVYRWDDHDPQNVPPFLRDLAYRFDTDGQRTGLAHAGTFVTDIVTGLIGYIGDHALTHQYEVTSVQRPEFPWVVHELTQSHDVVLLVGFWENQGENRWVRLGGHYVTLAGVDASQRQIALSDPDRDHAEFGFPGRVLPVWHPAHLTGTITVTLHNDAAFVSHDAYFVSGLETPGGVWALHDYAASILAIVRSLGANFPGELERYRGSYNGGAIIASVEYAIVVTPLETGGAGIGPKPTPAPTPTPSPTPTATPTRSSHPVYLPITIRLYSGW